MVKKMAKLGEEEKEWIPSKLLEYMHQGQSVVADRLAWEVQLN